MQLNREIHQTELDMEHALQEGDIEKARTWKETRENLQASREKLEKKNRRVSKNKVPVVGENEIADVVAGWTKIPVSRLTESEASLLQKLEETLHKRVIGQEEAVSAVSKAVRRGRVGLKDPKRPIGSFLFWTNRYRKDGSFQSTGRGCVWQRGIHDPGRYVGVYGKA